MPIILLNLLRPLIMWIATITVTTLIADAIAELLKALVGAIAEHYNIPEDDAKIVVVNKIIDVAALVGVGTGTVYAKIGVKAADYLGIKTLSAGKRALSPAAKAAMERTDILPTAKAAASKSVWGFIKKVPITQVLMGAMLFQNIGDWYFFKTRLFTDTFNAIFGNDVLGAPDTTSPPPGFSSGEFASYAAALEASGVVGISSEQAQQSQIYSRDNLKLLITWVYGQQLKTADKTSLKILQAEAEKYLIRKSANGTVSTGSPTSASGTSTPPAAAAPVKTQIFTGVVANGVLGAPKQFESVGDGYITSNDDLMETASQTLANFILTLPAKFKYEISIVNSFKSPGGVSLKGESVQIVSSRLKDGTPKYKTIYKKFAVLHVWILDANGRQVTLIKENMGQVNATDFTPTMAQLAQVSATITPSIFTSNVEHITGIESNAAVTVSSPPPVSTQTATDKERIAAEVAKIEASGLTPEMKARIAAAPQTQYKFYKYSVNGVEYFAADAYAGNTPYGYTPITAQEFLTGGLAFRAKHPVDGATYVTDAMLALARSVSPDASGAGQSPYVLIDGVPFRK